MDRFDNIKYLACKVRVYFFYTMPILLPLFYAFLAFDNLWHIIPFGLFGGMFVLHLMVTEDNEAGHKELKLLVMRKRHFKDVVEK